jgi:Tfp pilus assembly PilM family ATPase
VRDAGLRPEGVDLSAFALIRSLYRPDPEHTGRVLYLNVDGLTNMAIAEGTLCRFTRVVGGGIEAMASELAERRSIPLVEARELIAAVDLTLRPAPEPVAQSAVAEAEAALELEPPGAIDPEAPTAIVGEASPPADDAESVEAQDERERDMSYAEMAGVTSAPAEVPEPDAPAPVEAPRAPVPARASQASDVDLRTVLENGIREIAGEVRNSLDFHRSQEGGGEVARVVLSGAALDLPGFAEALQEQLGVQVERESVSSDGQGFDGISPHRLAIAAGLAVEEAPR